MSEVVERAIYELTVRGGESLAHAGQLLDRLSVSEEKVDRATRTTTDGLARLIARYDQRARAEQDLVRRLEQINRYEQEGVGSTQARGRAVELVTQKYMDQVRALNGLNTATNDNGRAFARANSAANDNRRAMDQASVGARQAQFALTNLSFQINDVVSGLTSGQEPFRIFAQQAGQFVQVFQQGGGISNVLSSAGAAIRGWISPMSVAATGALALAGGVALLLGKAIELENKFRTFNVVLKGFGNEGLTTAGNLEQMERDLRRIGLAADEASEAIQKVLRTPGANPAAAGTLARTGAGLGVLTGAGTVAETQRLAQLVADTDVEGLIKLGVQLTAITGPQAKFIRDQKEMKGSVAATDDALGLIANHLKDTYANSLSAFAKAMRDLSTAFTEFLRDAAVSQFIQEGLARIKTTLDEIRGILNAVNDLSTRFTRTGDQATQKALEAQKELNQALADRDRAAGGTPPALGAERFSLGGLGANTEALQRLSAVLAEASKSLPEGFRVEARSATRPGSSGQHGAGNAVDVRIVGMSGPLPNQGPIGSNPGLYQDLAIAAFQANQRLFPGTPLTWGGRFETRPGSGMLDWMHFDTAPDRGRFGPPLADLAQARATAVPSTMPDGSASSAVALRDQTNLLEKQTREYEKLNKARSLDGLEQVREEARIRGLIEAEAQGVKGKDALTFANNAANQAVRERVIELEKEARNQDQATQGSIKAVASSNTEAEAYRNIALAQAELRVRTGQATDVQATQTRILEESAAAAVLAGKQQVLAAQPQILAQERVAEAAKQGAAAQREAERQMEASTRTQDALAKAEASRNPILIEQARALNDAAVAEIRRSDAAKASLANTQAIRNEQESQQVLALQVRLQGQTAEHINTQVNLLRTKIELDKQVGILGPKEVESRLAAVAATGQMTEKLAAAQREQQRIEDGIRSIASTINAELTRSIEDAFSGRKVEDWGTRIKRMLGSLAAQISDALFIKPLLGSIVGALGFGNVASSLGSFGGLFGGSGGASLVQTGTNAQGQPTFSLSNASSVLSLGNNLFGGGGGFFGDLFGGSGGGLFSGVKDFFSGGLGGIFKPSFGADFIGPVAPGSIFGNLTLGQAFTGIGAGFGAGSLLNSLLGGDPLMGSIGSGIGSLAGTLLPAALGFSLGPFGGILGGALGGLFGLFGNNKPRNQSAGANFDLSSFSLTAGFAGGNAQIDQATQQVAQGLQQFLALLKTTGGTLSGNVLLQNGVNTGFTVDSSLPGYSGRFNLGRDPTAALNTISLALARSLTGISDTMRTVIDQVGDPAELQSAIAFATAYDNLKTAAEDAFKTVEDGKNELGPFATAMEQIKTLFQGLSDQATRFGLALEPINAALAEATRRLQTDFTTALNVALKEATGLGFINQIQGIWDSYLASIAESQAIGLGADRATQDLLGQVATAQINQILAGLDAAQIDRVIAEFSGLNDIIVQLAETAEIAASATAELYQSLEDFAASLQTGSLSGLSTVDQLAAANDNFQATLALVNAGDTSQIDELIAAGQTAVSLSQDAYGNGPQTEGLRQDILAAIDAVLATRSFASGGIAPAGWNRVGEQGAEWLYMPTPAMVLPSGTNPPAIDPTSSLSALGELLRVGNMITQSGLMELVKELRAARLELQRQPIQDAPRTKVAA